MPTYPPRVFFNTCSNVMPCWTFPKPNRVALYSQPHCSNPQCNIMMPNHSHWLAGCLLFPLHCEPPRAGTMSYSIPRTQHSPGTHTKKVACLGQLLSRFGWEGSSSSCPFLFLHDPSGFHFNYTSSSKAQLATLAWSSLPHGSVVPHPLLLLYLPYFVVVACLPVCQAYLIFSFHEVMDQECLIHFAQHLAQHLAQQVHDKCY